MTNVSGIQLDEAILERIASIICGDDDGLLYRRGFEIVKFFRAAGWSVPDEVDGPSRRAWTLARLQEGQNDGTALARLVMRLADRREYLDEEGDRQDANRSPESLINLARDNRWIAKDVVDYAHVLRDHRNLVHPRKQWKQAYSPEDDTVVIAWQVVVAALNDLAVLGPPAQR